VNQPPGSPSLEVFRDAGCPSGGARMGVAAELRLLVLPD
jgi:hypothetical protein